jgi:RNA polymerase sigma-70 factor (ECF subfamily)
MLGAAISLVPPTKFAPPAAGSPSAEDLMAEVARGDRAAFSRLYRGYAPRLKAYLMRGGLAAGEAEDVVQEAMVRVWRKAPLFDPAKASVGAWMFAIVRNLRIDFLRRRSRPPGDIEERTEEADTGPLADETLERKTRDARIRAVFAALPPNQHQVVVMHFIDDEPHSTIAKRLNLPLGTVKSRLRLAFARIRRELDEFK